MWRLRVVPHTRSSGVLILMDRQVVKVTAAVRANPWIIAQKYLAQAP